MKLTDKERTALIAAVEVNTTVADADEGDFFSYFYPKEIVEATGFSKEQVAGLLSSLESKGMVAEEQSQNKKESLTEWAVLWEAIEQLRGEKEISALEEAADYLEKN